MGSAENQVWFGQFRYDPSQKVLFRDGAPVSLQPKTAELLHVLITRRGEVVEKAELMRLVWPDTTVEDTGLARNVSMLRKALGDEADEGAIIETVPRRGYRFAASLQPAEPPPQTPSRWLWPALSAALVVAIAGGLVYWQFYAPGKYLPQGERASVAVAPFEILSSPNPGFARGLEEQIAAELAASKNLYVTSPATVHRYSDKGIPVPVMSRMLRLDAVVEGTIQTHGQGVRITARVADLHSGKLIWAETYELEPAEAARRIAQGVGGIFVLKQ